MQMDTDLPRPKEPCSVQCPLLIRETLDLIAAKWTVPIFIALYTAPAPLRYAELRRQIGAITPKELAKHLRQFAAAGLIHRQVHATVPPQVEYSLTGLGRSLYPSLEGLADWAARFGGAVARNRQAGIPPARTRLIKPVYKLEGEAAAATQIGLLKVSQSASLPVSKPR